MEYYNHYHLSISIIDLSMFYALLTNIICYLPKMSELFQDPYIYSTVVLKHLEKYQGR